MSDYGDFHISSPFYWLTFDSISATQGVSSNFLGYPVGQDTDSRYRFVSTQRMWIYICISERDIISMLLASQ